MSSSPSTAEQPLQSVSAATGNVQPAEKSISTKADQSGQAAAIRPVSTGGPELSTSAKAKDATYDAAADTKGSNQEGEASDMNESKLFAGHEVTSFVVEEEEDDSGSIRDDEQQTVSNTPYDELD